MKITSKELKAKKACKDQIETFAVQWGDEVEVTEEVLQEAAELGLDLEWLILNFLSPAKCRDFHKIMTPALAVLNETRHPAQIDFHRGSIRTEEALKRSIESAKAVYNETLAAAEVVYNKNLSLIEETYNETMDPEMAIYFRAIASAAWQVISNMNEDPVDSV